MTRASRRLATTILVTSVGGALGACAGGGGGGGVAVTPPTTTAPVVAPPPSPPPPPPPPPSAQAPSATSAEYQRSYGLAAIHADAAYAAGASGKSVTVAVLDTGVERTQQDLAANVSSASTDIVASRAAPDGESRHGTYVAGVIASTFNGQGTLGVAYNSTVLSVRTDAIGSCASTSAESDKSGCKFNSSDLARGIDYAVAHGARILNLSLGGSDPLGSEFEAALNRAIGAGLVVVAAAGNESQSDPAWPGRYAVDSRFAGALVAVGATDASNQLASYSNKAGVAAQGYLVAPGEKVVSTCDATSCWILSGTSFAAPHVSGALALLLQAFPNLTGRAALDLLLRTADDLGATGVDSTYGRGLVNLARAFAPVGSLGVATPSGSAVTLVAAPGASLSGAFGDSVRATGALQTVAYDSYQRLYRVDLAGAFPAAPRTSLQGAFAEPSRSTATVVSDGKGTRFELASARPLLAPPSPPGLAFRRDADDRGDVHLTGEMGRFSFEARTVATGAGAAVLGGGGDAFTLLASARQAARAGVEIGGLRLSGEAGGGSTYDRYGLRDLKASSYAVARLAAARGAWAGELSYGALEEPEGPLGSLLPHATGIAAQARTRFGAARVSWTGARLRLTGEGGLGRTQAEGPWLRLEPGALSSSWRIAASSLCDRPGCLRMTAEVAQPVRIESGVFTAVLADVPAAYGDPLRFSERRFSAAPAGRELDLKLGVARDWAGGALQLQGLTIVDEQNRRGAPVNVGLLASWARGF